MERELRLRNHIRGLLLDYCRAHITEDYVTFTQDAVQTLLSDRIDFVPLEDPNSITLPVDPMGTLLSGLDASLIPEEKWAADAGTLDHVRKSINLGVTPLATSKCWHEIDPYERAVESFRPMSPILSRQALRQTPEFGKSRAATSPDSLRSALDAYTLVPVPIPEIPTPPLPNLEDILDIQYKIEPSLHRETMTLIRSVHMGTKPAPDQTNTMVEAFFRSKSPPLPVIATMEVPMFPRTSWPGFAVGSPTDSNKMPRSLSSSRYYLAPVVEIEDEDLSMEHMRAVDGWATYPPISSPSPTPSLGLGDTSSQVVELFPPSPPAAAGDGPSILELESLKMEEVQIPRQSRIGHVGDGLSHLPQSLASLLPQHNISLVNSGTNQAEHRPLECIDDTTITSSMFGQPPSKFDTEGQQESSVDEDDLKSDLRAIWSKVGCDEFEIILCDGIDESKALLLEVPQLPPPTVHEPWEQLPTNLKLLASSLGMVKGIRPLNLELSWVPFKYGSKVPTDEEVSRVSDDILDDLTILVGQHPPQGDEIRRILSDLVSPTPSELISDLAFVEHTHPEDFTVAGILSNDSIRLHQLVLTRDERYRISRTGADLHGKLMPNSLHNFLRPTSDGVAPTFDAGGDLFEELEFSLEVPRHDSELEYLEPEGYEGGDDEIAPPPAKKQRLGNSSPLIVPHVEQPNLSSNMDSTHQTAPLHIAAHPSPKQTEYPNSHLLHPPIIPQNAHNLSSTTSQTCNLAHLNPSNTVRQFVPSVINRATEPGPTPPARNREVDEFLALRGVRLDEPSAATTTETVMDDPRAVDAPAAPWPAVTVVPPDVIDKDTIQVPIAGYLPVSRHQYLASLDLLQKHALCRCLSDGPAAIDLVEREFLGGVDLILDQDTAILFLPLSALPSECEGLIAGISDISWRYSHILVIFEAFLTSQAFGGGEENLVASFAFTEPILKSVKKLKRSLLIADGVGTKMEDCHISWAFARNIEEAAGLARVYGDMAESRDTTEGSLWQERWWLGEREADNLPLSEFEDESDLGMVGGMNAFAACLILSQMPSDQFLSATPQERTERFGQLLGTRRMAELNRSLEQSDVALSSESLPVSDLRDSSSTQP